MIKELASKLWRKRVGAEIERVVGKPAAKRIEERAQAIEAQRAETENTGSVADESAVPKGNAP